MTSAPQRVIPQYDPMQDHRDRYPHWIFKPMDLSYRSINEAIDAPAQVAIYDPEGDRAWAVAVLIAHLDLGHHLGSGTFTAQQLNDAADLARIRLDDPFAMMQVDGPPTVNLYAKRVL